MEKPRIIIADTDENYVIPLQLKFIEDFFEKVELEIITDSEFFSKLFSTPQKADILIVSENLYDPSLQRHNIAHVFLMTERNEEEETADLTVNRIFKYTSIKEIFNEITGKSAGVLNIAADEPKETQVILVYSASGGVGKTTVAMGISACLNRNYKRTLYINASRLPLFQTLLSNPGAISSTDVYAKMVTADEEIYPQIKHVIRSEGFQYLPPFRAALMSLGISNRIYEKIVLSAKRSRDYDYIVVDADTVLDEDKTRLLDLADKVIMVTRQNKASVSATNFLLSNINGVRGDKYIFVCNDFNRDAENALISPDIENRFSVSDYIGHIDHYEQWNAGDLANETDIQKVAFLVM